MVGGRSTHIHRKHIHSQTHAHTQGLYTDSCTLVLIKYKAHTHTLRLKVRTDLLLLGGLCVKIRAARNKAFYLTWRRKFGTVSLRSSFKHTWNVCGRARSFLCLAPITEGFLNENESRLKLYKPRPRLHFCRRQLCLWRTYTCPNTGDTSAL